MPVDLADFDGLGTLVSTLFRMEGGDTFHSPDVSELYLPIVAFKGTPFAMDRITLARILMMLILVVAMVLYARRAALVPGRAQFVMESGFDFCRRSICEDIMGKDMARKYAPIITAIFFTVFVMNVTSVIPGINLAGTALPGFPLFLAVLAWFIFVYAGIKEVGLGSFLKSSLFPSGVPWVLYFVLTPIELVSTFIIRPFTLFVRLLANMISGHFMLALCISATNYFLFQVWSALSPIGILTFAAAFAFTLFEILVAFLQAYIFALLTAVYVNLSVHPH